MSIYCRWLVLFTVRDCYSFSFVFKLCLLNYGIFGEFWPRGLNLASFLAKVFRFRTDQALRRKFPTSKRSKAHLNISSLTNRSQAWISVFFILNHSLWYSRTFNSYASGLTVGYLDEWSLWRPISFNLQDSLFLAIILASHSMNAYFIQNEKNFDLSGVPEVIFIIIVKNLVNPQQWVKI